MSCDDVRALEWYSKRRRPLSPVPLRSRNLTSGSLEPRGIAKMDRTLARFPQGRKHFFTGGLERIVHFMDEVLLRK